MLTPRGVCTSKAGLTSAITMQYRGACAWSPDPRGNNLATVVLIRSSSALHEPIPPSIGVGRFMSDAKMGAEGQLFRRIDL